MVVGMFPTGGHGRWGSALATYLNLIPSHVGIPFSTGEPSTFHGEGEELSGHHSLFSVHVLFSVGVHARFFFCSTQEPGGAAGAPQWLMNRSGSSLLFGFHGRPTSQGQATHPKKPPTQIKNCSHKQFAQTLSVCFCLFKREKGGQFAQTVPKLFAQTMLLFGCFFLS